MKEVESFERWCYRRTLHLSWADRTSCERRGNSINRKKEKTEVLRRDQDSENYVIHVNIIHGWGEQDKGEQENDKSLYLESGGLLRIEFQSTI